MATRSAPARVDDKSSSAKSGKSGGAKAAATRQRKIQDTVDRNGSKGRRRQEAVGRPVGGPRISGAALSQAASPEARRGTQDRAGADVRRALLQGLRTSSKARSRSITGGDSGIGRAVAVLFAREGADVAIVYLSEHEDAEDTKAAVEAEGRRCILIAGRRRRSAHSAARRSTQTVKELGGLDVLVNNAAFQVHVDRVRGPDARSISTRR